jgi:hypothetical protein
MARYTLTVQTDNLSDLARLLLGEAEATDSEPSEALVLGKLIANRLIEQWSVGFGEEDTEQPDRMALVGKILSNREEGTAWWNYVRQFPDLTSAWMDAGASKEIADHLTLCLSAAQILPYDISSFNGAS